MKRDVKHTFADQMGFLHEQGGVCAGDVVHGKAPPDRYNCGCFCNEEQAWIFN
ncbi:hypothetical protein [Wenzhouxiangella limi]|uniref:hypothetical protein n=1 Tax=Wenzhouxiangella limi TaxID=2707351 RepID=UPI001942B462|nr:hypothetical protein [Wenzhouxiangella limi]